MRKSIFITGAPGTGKSTTYRELIDWGYQAAPNHITRPPREEEVDGIDACFINETEFVQNLNSGLYLESADEAYYGGVYYGSPVEWEQTVREQATSLVATPSNVLTLGKMCTRLGEQNLRDGLLWVNLVAPVEIRRQRIMHRVASAALLEHRLYSGVSQGEQSEADANLDTHSLKISEVVRHVVELAE